MVRILLLALVVGLGLAGCSKEDAGSDAMDKTGEMTKDTMDEGAEMVEDGKEMMKDPVE